VALASSPEFFFYRKIRREDNRMPHPPGFRGMRPIRRAKLKLEGELSEMRKQLINR
jgi:hypothetical protein